MELTQKEFNVAYLYSQGLRMKQVAHQNKISIWTCYDRMRSVYKKLGINNSFELHHWFLGQPI